MREQLKAKIEALAAKLDGREYTKEVTDAEVEQAASDGLVILYGGSDDLAEFRGAINDEAGCVDGGMLLILDGKLWQGVECDCKHAEEAQEQAESLGSHIDAEWCKGDDYSWTYSTDIPHATFDVMEDGEKFCRGIVFALEDAK